MQNMFNKIGVHQSEDEKANPKMDDLLREIKKLSAKIKGSEDSSSSKEGTTTSQPTSAKKIAKKRQKCRNKKHKGRKRQLKYIPDFGAGSSSFTDCTDEEIIRDYIENITANLSDSDVDLSLKNAAFLVNKDLTSAHDFSPHHPEVDETDSYSESFLLTRSRKKQRRYKRHSMDCLSQPVSHVTNEQRHRVHNVLMKQYTSCSHMKKRFDHEMEVSRSADDAMEISQESSIGGESSSENSESDAVSNSPGSEADDEGEESCVESTLAVKPVIPWWEPQQLDYEMCTEPDVIHGVLEQSLNIIRGGRSDFSTRLKNKNNATVSILCESGGFVAYSNHKIKNFVQHRDSNELSLTTTTKKEQNQVMQLAILYNLRCSIEEASRSSKVVLTKTRNTKDADQQSLKLFLSREVKLRYRKSQPHSQWNSKRRKIQTMVEANGYSPEKIDIPIPDSNVGSIMLRTMGWKPGQGLGRDNDGIINPVKAVKRPTNLGFGHPVT